MIETKRLRERYDWIARHYMNMLIYHARTGKAVMLEGAIRIMENLDKNLYMLGEK